MSSKLIVPFLSLFFLCGTLVVAHVRLLAPVSRSSMWRNPQFAPHNPPINYDDDGLYCGSVPQEEVVTTCGLCGDPFSSPTPRANEHGGRYGRGVIAANYSAGQVEKMQIRIVL